MAEESFDDKKIDISFSKLLFSCGVKTLIAAMIIGIVAVCFGLLIEHSEIIANTISSTWTNTIDLLAFNNHFWKAATLSCVSICVLFCALCILSNLNCNNKAYIKIILFSIICFIFWFLTERAVANTYVVLKDLNIYQIIMLFIIHIRVQQHIQIYS